MAAFLKASPLQTRNTIRQRAWSFLLISVYIVIAIPVLREYLDCSSVNFIIGLGAMPLMISIQKKNIASNRFALLAFALMSAGFFVPVKTILFLSLCCVVLSIIESTGKRLTALPLLTFFMMSPVCQYFTHIFSFPIRMWLTGIAGSILKYTDPDTAVAGNIISFGKADFSVDPACMGLNMLITSLLCGLIMLAVFQKRKEKILSLKWVLAGLVIIFLLNIIANLIRILLLVYFRLLPENPMHEMTGIICLIVYVLLPGSFVLKGMVNKFARPMHNEEVCTQRCVLPTRNLHWILLPVFIFLAFRNHQHSTAPPGGTLPVLKGYNISWYDKEVIKMENSNALIYVKPLKGFVYTDHNPLICWTGSGYTFKNVQEGQWGNISLFTGVLIKGNEKLFTAWWYDNGTTATISQWAWRWKMFRNEATFSIINISANDMETLKSAVADIAAKRKDILPGR